MTPDQSGRSRSTSTPDQAVGCDHPESALSPAMLREDARYCRLCSSLVMDDGTTEPVTIRRVR